MKVPLLVTYSHHQVGVPTGVLHCIGGQPSSNLLGYVGLSLHEYCSIVLQRGRCATKNGADLHLAESSTAAPQNFRKLEIGCPDPMINGEVVDRPATWGNINTRVNIKVGQLLFCRLAVPKLQMFAYTTPIS